MLQLVSSLFAIVGGALTIVQKVQDLREEEPQDVEALLGRLDGRIARVEQWMDQENASQEANLTAAMQARDAADAAWARGDDGAALVHIRTAHAHLDAIPLNVYGDGGGGGALPWAFLFAGLFIAAGVLLAVLGVRNLRRPGSLK